MELLNPDDVKALQHIIGMFAYHTQWIPRHFKRAKPLLYVEHFPLSDEAISALESLKKCFSTITLGDIDESLLFTVETDVSEQVISVTLNQQNHPVAFFSRTLNNQV